MDNNSNSGKKKAASVLATLSLVFAILSIFLAIGLDVFAFKEAIFKFIFALILPIPAFIIFVMLMVVSCIFIFGFYLLDQYGFWPLDWAINLFKEMMGDIKITADQIFLFRVFRIVLLVICFSLLTMAIVSKVLDYEKKEMVPEVVEGEEPPIKKKDRTTGATSTVAIVFIVLGILVSVAALALSMKM